MLIDKERKLFATAYQAMETTATVTVMFPEYDKEGKLDTDRPAYYKRLASGSGYRAKPILQDKIRGLAIFEIVDEKALPKHAAAAMARFDPPLKDAKVFSMDNPYASEHLWTYAPGTAVKVDRVRFQLGTGHNEFMEIDTKIIDAKMGVGGMSSGGSLYNSECEWIGVCLGNAQSFSTYRFVQISELKALCDEQKLKVDWKLPAQELEVLPVPKNWKEREEAAAAILKWVVAWNTIKLDGQMHCFNNPNAYEEYVIFCLDYEKKRKLKGAADPDVAAMRERIEKLGKLMVDRSDDSEPSPPLTPAGVYRQHMRMRLAGERHFSNTLRHTLAKDRDTLARMKADPANVEKIGFPLSKVELESIVFQNQTKQYQRRLSFMKVQISLLLLEAVRIIEEAS